MPLPVIERLIDAFRRPNLEPEEREALIVYLREARRILGTEDPIAGRCAEAMKIVSLRDEHAAVANRWMAIGTRHMHETASQILKDYLALEPPPVAAETHQAFADLYRSMREIFITMEAGFQAIVLEAPDEEFRTAVAAVTDGQRPFSRLRRRANRSWRRLVRRHGITDEELSTELAASA